MNVKLRNLQMEPEKLENMFWKKNKTKKQASLKQKEGSKMSDKKLGFCLGSDGLTRKIFGLPSGNQTWLAGQFWQSMEVFF